MIISNPDATIANGWISRSSYTSSVTASSGLYGIAWDPGFNRWIGIPNIAGSSTTGYMVTSQTGSSWTQRTQLYNATTFTFGTAVAYSSTNACLVAVGNSSASGTSSIIWYSINGGLTWTSAAPSGITTATFRLQCLVWAPSLNLWVLGGANGTSTTTVSIIYTSTDIYARSGWTLRNTGVFGNNISGAIMNGVAWNGSNLFVAVGGPTVNFATSTDGVTWTGRGTITNFGTGTAVCWVSSQNVWIATGNSSAGLGSGSANGQTWTATGPAGFVGNAVATNNRIIVAVGTYVTSSIYYSYNASTWYSVLNANTLFFSTGRSVAWNGSLWVATGTLSGNGVTITSPDGVNWTISRTFTTYVNAIAFQNREKTFTISNSHWTGRTSQQTFRILG